MFWIPLCAALLTCLLSRNEWAQDEDRQWTTSTTHRQKTDDEWRSTEAEKFTWISISTQNKCQFEPLFSRCCVDFLCSFFLCFVVVSRAQVKIARYSLDKQLNQRREREAGRRDRQWRTNRARYIESNILPSQWRRLSSWRIIHDRKNYSFFREWKKQIIVLDARGGVRWRCLVCRGQKATRRFSQCQHHTLSLRSCVALWHLHCQEQKTLLALTSSSHSSRAPLWRCVL